MGRPLSSTPKKEKRPVDPMGPAVSLFKYTQTNRINIPLFSHEKKRNKTRSHQPFSLLWTVFERSHHGLIPPPQVPCRPGPRPPPRRRGNQPSTVRPRSTSTMTRRPRVRWDRFMAESMPADRWSSLAFCRLKKKQRCLRSCVLFSNF